MQININLLKLSADECANVLKCALESNTEMSLTRDENGEYDITANNLCSPSFITNIVPILFSNVRKIDVTESDEVKKTTKIQKDSSSDDGEMCQINPKKENVLDFLMQNFFEKIQEMANELEDSSFFEIFTKAMNCYEKLTMPNELQEIFKEAEKEASNEKINLNAFCTQAKEAILKKEVAIMKNCNPSLKESYPKLQYKSILKFYVMCYKKIYIEKNN